MKDIILTCAKCKSKFDIKQMNLHKKKAYCDCCIRDIVEGEKDTMCAKCWKEAKTVCYHKNKTYCPDCYSDIINNESEFLFKLRNCINYIRWRIKFLTWHVIDFIMGR